MGTLEYQGEEEGECDKRGMLIKEKGKREEKRGKENRRRIEK